MAFLVCSGGRTPEADRHDLRALFQWAADHDRSYGAVIGQQERRTST
jgi:hypothetical protein